MKRLSELGISPMPWGLDYNTKEYVIDSVEDNVCYVDGDTIEQAYANAHMLKAAPKMYEALRQSTNMIEYAIQFIKNRDIKIALQELADDNKAILAEAAGESEAKMTGDAIRKLKVNKEGGVL